MPFCPKCKSEYRQGYTVCVDCQVPLVDKLSEDEQISAESEFEMVPTEIKTSSLKYITVFVSDGIEEAAKVKRILNENKIPFITKGEDTEEFRYVDFLVREDKVEEAKKLLKGIIEQESTGIETEPSMIPKTEEDFEVPKAPSVFHQAKKESNNFYLFILITVIIGVVFISGIEKLIKYIISGILILFFIAKLIYFSDKRV